MSASDTPTITEASPVSDEAARRRLGRYQLLEKLGEGGFGAVWLAEQKEPVRRKVALKIIKLGMDTKAVVARFEAERQALAMMEHPNIAKVLDAGSTEQGRPYFVMELVKGIRITEYCDQNDLSSAERLNLFIQVCHAIQHAHQKGIIHRDIKPSNILVTVTDGVPVPKVIDFGIAKATEGRLVDATVHTQLHQFIGTPAYMSPEQAEMSGLDIDTRSDIYSLGVLLYELLTGTTPFDSQELISQGIDGMRRTIREKEPPRPSTKLSQAATVIKGNRANSGSAEGPATDEEAKASSRRLMRLRETVALLRGDLDWIVMKCLEKDRTRRYETANGIAADLKRHLDNEPVVARPPSLGYRLQKSFRRNKLVFITAGLVGWALLVGTVVSIGLAVKASRAASQARYEKERANQVAGFLKAMLKTVGPSVSRGRDTTLLREILTNTVARLDKEFGDRPAVEAELRMTVGLTYRDLGEYGSAAEMHQRALELNKRVFGNRSAQVADCLNALAADYTLLGDEPKGETWQREAIAIREQTLGTNNLVLADAYNDLGIILIAGHKSAEGRNALLASLAIKDRLLTPPNESLSLAHLNLSFLLFDLGEFGEGEKHARLALNGFRDVFGDKLPSDKVAMALHNQAKHLRELNRLPEAEQALRDAMNIYGKLYPDGHSYSVEAFEDLGRLLQKKGDAAGAADAFRRGVEMGRKVLGPDHPQTLVNMRQLASVLGASPATSSEGDELMQSAMGSARVKFASQPELLATCLLDQANYLSTIKARPADTESVLLEAYNLLKSSRNGGVQLKRVCVALESLYTNLARPEEAKKWASLAERPAPK